MDCSIGTWPKFATTGDSPGLLGWIPKTRKRPKIGSHLGYPPLEQMGHWGLVETEGWEIGWEANVLNPFLTYSDIQIHHIIYPNNKCAHASLHVSICPSGEFINKFAVIRKHGRFKLRPSARFHGYILMSSTSCVAFSDRIPKSTQFCLKSESLIQFNPFIFPDNDLLFNEAEALGLRISIHGWRYPFGRYPENWQWLQTSRNTLNWWIPFGMDNGPFKHALWRIYDDL